MPCSRFQHIYKNPVTPYHGSERTRIIKLLQLTLSVTTASAVGTAQIYIPIWRWIHDWWISQYNEWLIHIVNIAYTKQKLSYDHSLTRGWPHSTWAISLADNKRRIFQRALYNVDWYWGGWLVMLYCWLAGAQDGYARLWGKTSAAGSHIQLFITGISQQQGRLGKYLKAFDISPRLVLSSGNSAIGEWLAIWRK